VSPPILISMTKNMNMIKKGRIEKKKLEHDQLELKNHYENKKHEHDQEHHHSRQHEHKHL
jgi:hypothetical protein